MNTIVNYELAKLLKEKGFDLECEYFYSKYGSFNNLKPYRKYEHLHSYSERIVQYFDGKYDWNSLNVDEGMIALKTAFSESDGYVNCECSAPIIVEVVMWCFNEYKYSIEYSMNIPESGEYDGCYVFNGLIKGSEDYKLKIFYTSKDYPTIEKTLEDTIHYFLVNFC